MGTEFTQFSNITHFIFQFSTPEKQHPQPVTLCICDREKQKILCRSCGAVFDGRIRKKCVIHPNEIHLMDILCCPNCKTNYLQEIGGTPAAPPSSNNEVNNNVPATVKKISSPVPMQVGSDRMLLKQITRNMNRQSENWEDDLNLVNNNRS